jgi:lysophospholipase L1-like esterase
MMPKRHKNRLLFCLTLMVVKTRWNHAAALVLVGILLGLASIELLLNLASSIIYGVQTHRPIAEGVGIIRILALGESTTAGSIDSSWPMELEAMLNNRGQGIRYEVYNEGIPGTNSAMILASFERNLQKYKPHIVITMMGVNDGSYQSMLGNYTLRYDPSMKDSGRLKILRLARWLQLAWKNMGLRNAVCDPSLTERELNDLDKRYTEEVLDILEFYPENAITERNEYQKLGFYHEHVRGDPNASIPYYRRAMENDGSDYISALALAKIYRAQDSRKAECYLGKASAIAHSNPLVQTTLNSFYVDAADESGFWQEEGIPLRNLAKGDVHEATSYHYQAICRILNERGIKYYAMQYPTLDIGIISAMFNGTEEVVFISNKDNFEEAVSTNGYFAYFSDRMGTISNPEFYGEYGHMTSDGNMLVADRVASVILNLSKA